MNLKQESYKICKVSPYKFQVNLTWLSTHIYRFRRWPNA